MTEIIFPERGNGRVKWGGKDVTIICHRCGIFIRKSISEGKDRGLIWKAVEDCRFLSGGGISGKMGPLMLQ